MWLLSPEQVARLVALQRGRDLQLIGEALAVAFPEVRGRLGERWSEVVEHGATRAAAYGLAHILCVARFLASWVACGAEFETRQAWAAAILTDARRSQGAKAYQLCVRVLEQLGSVPQAGQPPAADFAVALRQIDARLASAGTLASLLPRERIRLGAACDVDAVELRLVDPGWRQHYTAQAGPWRREACAPQAIAVTLVHDPLADAAPRLPQQLTLLSHPASGDISAKLRVRVKAEHRCDALLHPFLQALVTSGPRSLRGDLASDVTIRVHAQAATAGASLPHIGEESSPEFSTLTVASCGLRARGVPMGELWTLLAAYDASQHLIAWRREPTAPWQLPADTPPAPIEARCRRELDGQPVDSSSWVSGFKDLDAQLQSGVARLLTAWERESGVVDGQLAVDAALLVGSSGITWGWAEGPQGIAMPPYMRLEGLFDLVACRLALRFTGALARAGSRSLLTLSTDGSAALAGPWKRGPDDAALFAVAGKLQRIVEQRFDLAVHPFADAGLAVLTCCGPLRGAIRGVVGLEQRTDGPGLRWFVRLAVEPVVAPLRIFDPLLGVRVVQQPLLPAQVLVDWSQG
ncbi:MAG: hypothetical protein ABI520_03690 [Caldimonas sp.]